MSAARRRFRIIKEIAEGGFGKVYLAEQISSDGFSRIVAVKLLHAKWSSHDEVVMRTRDEARLLGLVRHQHIVKVEDLTAIDGKCAIVMEYLEGVDLKWMMQFLKDKGQVFPRSALFEIVLAVASALDAAYNGTPLQGGEPLKVIHRDIKPSNVFVTVAGGVKVLDFGTARANFAEREAKTQALAFGSQDYMAPERMLGEEDTPAADIFSLGITLYELLTLESFGRIPPRPNKFLKKIDERVAAVPLQGEPEWVSRVRDTLRRMLSYDPKERPPAAQLVETMELLAQDAKDMGLRRYCRTLVAEAKAALPELEAGDPITGTVVEEDASASFTTTPVPGTLPSSVGAGVPPARATSVGAGVPPARATSVGAGVPPARATSVGAGVPPARASSTSGETRTTSSGAWSTTDAVPSVATPPRDRGGSKAIWIVALGVALLVAAVVVLAGVFGLGAAMVFGGDLAITGGVPIEVPQPPPAPAPPEPAGIVGSRIVSPDARTDVARVQTVLSYSDPAGGAIELKGPGGFRAEWDGKAPFDLGATGEGVYQATITTASGTKHRLERFTVEPKGECAFTFDAAGGEWRGRCE